MLISERTIEYVIKARDETAGVIKGFESRLKTTFSSLNRLKYMTLGFTTAAVAGITKLAMSAGKVQQLEIAFTNMTGSAETAHKLLKDLADFASRTPFTISGVENSARQLIAMGFGAEEVLDNLRRLSDVSAGLSLGEEGLQRLVYNLGQVRTQGKLTGLDLRQFLQAGVPMIDALASSMGVAKEQVMELVSAGKVGFDDVQKAMIGMTSEGGIFYRATESQTGTLVQTFSNLKDAVEKLSRTLGEPLIKPLTDLTQKVIDFASAVGNFVSEQPEFVAIIADAGLKFTALLAALTAIMFIMPVLAVALSPAGALAVAIMGLIFLISTLKEHWEAITAQFAAFGELIKFGLIVAIDYLTEKFKQFFKWVEDKLRALTNAAKQLISTITFGLIKAPVEKKQTGGLVRSAMTLVGEQGAELVSLPKGSKVYEAGLTRRILSERNNAQLQINAPIIGTVIIQNEADENRLVDKIQEALARIVQLRNLNAPA